MRKIRSTKYILLLVVLFLPVIVFSQTPKPNRIIDSLETLLKNSKEDTSKVRVLNNLGIQYFNSDKEKAKKFNKEAYELSLKLNDKKGLGNVYHVYGLIFTTEGNPDSGIYYHTKALELRKEIKYQRGIIISSTNLAQAYYAKSDLQNALKYFISAQMIAEETKDTVICANLYNNIGLVHNRMNDLDKALLYFNKSLAIKKRRSDLKSIGNTIVNIGMICDEKKQYQLAKLYFYDALEKFNSIDYKQGQGICYNNLGVILYNIGDFKGALESNLKSLEIKLAMEDEAGTASSYLNIGSDHYALGNISKAKEFHFKALGIIEKLGLKGEQAVVYEMLSKDFEAAHDLQKALFYYKKFDAMKDTVLNIEKSEQLTEMQTKYDTEKKDKEIIKQNSEIKEKDLETKQKETQRNAFIVGFLVVIVLMGFVFNSYRQKKKANKIITEQKSEVEKQRNMLDEKQKEILDSIHYAKRIQNSLLPSEKYIEKRLDDLTKNKKS